MSGNEMTVRSPAELETEADAYVFLERLRWGDDGPTECPHCGSEKGAWYLKPKDPGGRKSKGGSTARSQRRVWKCRENSCRRQFSVLTNTVLHATKMPVRAWVGAVVELCHDPAGVSARDIASRWDVTEKSAWAMLNRIQDALAQPEVAGAVLASNAPLWFELASAERQQVEQERARRDRAAAQALEARMRAEKEGAERVESDVKRALLEAEIGRERPVSSDATRAQTPSPATPSPAEINAAWPRSGVPTQPTEAVPSRAGSAIARRDSDGSEQVKSDVERALAEAFGEPLPAAKDRKSEPKTASPRGPKQRARPSSGGPQKGSAKSSAPRSQPVDNLAGERPGERARPETTEPTEPTTSALPARAEQRSRRPHQSGDRRVNLTSDTDSLGAGWLGATGADHEHNVSADHDQLKGIGATELGPAWASTSGDMSSETQLDEQVSPDREDHFSADRGAAEDGSP